MEVEAEVESNGDRQEGGEPGPGSAATDKAQVPAVVDAASGKVPVGQDGQANNTDPDVRALLEDVRGTLQTGMRAVQEEMASFKEEVLSRKRKRSSKDIGDRESKKDVIGSGTDSEQDDHPRRTSGQ